MTQFIMRGVLALMGLGVARAETESFQVLLPSGQPAKGAKVQLRTLVAHESGDGQRLAIQRFTTNTDGRILLETGPERRGVLLVVDVPGCALGLWPMGLGTNQVFRLGPEFEVTGRILQSPDRPVPGATVRVAKFGTSTFLRILPPLLKDIEGFAATTDKQGRFALRGARLNDHDFPPGASLWVETTLEGHRYSTSENVSYAPDVPLAEITLSTHGTVSVRVINGLTGTPLSGVEIRLRGRRGSWTNRRESLTQTTGDDGVFTFSDLPTHSPRRFKVGGKVLFEPYEGARSVDAKGLEVRLYPRVTRSASLLVADTGRPPILPVNVTFRQEEAAGSGWTAGYGDSLVHHWSSPDGRFTAEFPTGPFLLKVHATFMRHSPYVEEQAMELDASNTPVELRVARRPGLLVHTRLPGNPPINDPKWSALITSVSTNMNHSWTYADNRATWFYPVAQWGDPVVVKVEERVPKGERITLMERKTFAADPDQWPVVIDLPNFVWPEPEGSNAD